MRKLLLISFTLSLLIIAGGSQALAKPGENRPTKNVVDYDNDGYNSKRDCNDNDASIHPRANEICGDGIDQDCDGADELCTVSCTDRDDDGYAPEGGACGVVDCNDAVNSVYPGALEICGDGIDQNCDGADEACQVSCTDIDSDGYSAEGGDCGAIDCNDTADTVHPGASEICGDGIDQNCDGADMPCTGGPHAGLTYSGYPDNCLTCHNTEATDMHGSTHYQWTGEAPDMANNPNIVQGKLTNAVNSYCINIEGDWPVCGSCHAGRGKRPDDSTAGLENIDCLACHNEEYATARIRLPDGSMGVANPNNGMVQNIQEPTRATCLTCHAKAGGGDGVKRGDLSLQTITNNDPHFDVHMNTSGNNLSCQECHVFEKHRVIGKGSDLRPTDDLARGAEIKCITCHSGKDSPAGHSNENIGRHVARVSCQTCHIPTYAKVATETHRDWLTHHDGSPADGISGPGHPYTVKKSNLIPQYKFWNRLSDNSLLGDDASLTFNAAKGTYPTSIPLGDIEDGKLYPFKYKTGTQPKTITDDRLIALDTFEYLKGSGNVVTAIEKGLENMGYSINEPYEWVLTDTYQMLNHGVNPASDALQCSSCHGNTARMDLQGDIGYGLKAAQEIVCHQCHGSEDQKPFVTIHDKHVKDKGYDCSWCHSFSRPEKGLRMP